MKKIGIVIAMEEEFQAIENKIKANESHNQLSITMNKAQSGVGKLGFSVQEYRGGYVRVYSYVCVFECVCVCAGACAGMRGYALSGEQGSERECTGESSGV